MVRESGAGKWSVPAYDEDDVALGRDDDQESDEGEQTLATEGERHE